MTRRKFRPRLPSGGRNLDYSRPVQSVLLDVDFARAGRHEADAFSLADAAADVGRGEVDAGHRDDLNAAQNGVAQLAAQRLEIGQRPVPPVDGDDRRQLRNAGRVPPQRKIGQRVGPDQKEQLARRVLGVKLAAACRP